jgi:hypothetical protein
MKSHPVIEVQKLKPIIDAPPKDSKSEKKHFWLRFQSVERIPSQQRQELWTMAISLPVEG